MGIRAVGTIKRILTTVACRFYDDRRSENIVFVDYERNTVPHRYPKGVASCLRILPPLSFPSLGGGGEDCRAIHLIQDRWSYPAVPLFDDINVAYCLFL